MQQQRRQSSECLGGHARRERATTSTVHTNFHLGLVARVSHLTCLFALRNSPKDKYPTSTRVNTVIRSYTLSCRIRKQQRLSMRSFKRVRCQTRLLSHCMSKLTCLIGRKKRKAEELAQQILGKNRRSNTPLGPKKTAPGGSLASRVGVTKVATTGLSWTI